MKKPLCDWRDQMSLRRHHSQTSVDSLESGIVLVPRGVVEYTYTVHLYGYPFMSVTLIVSRSYVNGAHLLFIHVLSLPSTIAVLLHNLCTNIM